MNWYISALAEWTVAKREDWRLEQISGRAWLWLTLHAASAITLLVLAVENW
jgi:hypothetical protein